jgi:hypothetical protein
MVSLRGVSTCALKNPPGPVDHVKSTNGRVHVILTVDIEFIELETNRLLWDASTQQKIADGLEYPQISRREMGSETVGIQLSGFTV